MDDKLIIRDYPVTLWIFGASLLVCGLWLSLKAEGGWVFGLIMIAVGILLGLILASINTLIADRSLGALTIQNRWLFRKKSQEYPLRQVASVEVESQRTRDHRGRSGGVVHRLVLVLDSGEKIPTQGYYTSGFLSKEKKARRLRQFLGVTGTESPPATPYQAARQAVQQAYLQQTGDTAGVNWRTETVNFGGTLITRWLTDSFSWPGQFLFLAQKPKGSPSIFGGSSILSSLSEIAFRQLLKLYGFQPENTPGLETAQPVDMPDPTLEQYFASLTSDPYGARQLLSPWVISPLEQWAERHPLKTFQASGQGQTGQLVALFSTNGLILAFLGSSQQAQIDELTQLGVDLARALPAARPPSQF